MKPELIQKPSVRRYLLSHWTVPVRSQELFAEIHNVRDPSVAALKTACRHGKRATFPEHVLTEINCGAQLWQRLLLCRCFRSSSELFCCHASQECGYIGQPLQTQPSVQSSMDAEVKQQPGNR